MRSFYKILTNFFIGIFAGIIFTVLLLGWPISPHGIVEIGWTMRALVPGILWGGMNGVVVGLGQNVLKMKLVKRVLVGGIIGGISGFTFGLNSSFTFSLDNLFESLGETLWGIILGMVGGIISGIVIGNINRILLQLKINYFDKHDDERILICKDNSINIISGIVSGLYFGSAITFITGLYKILFEKPRYGDPFFEIYLLSVIGCFTGLVYRLFKPLTHTSIQNVIDGMMNGLLASLLAIPFFLIILLGLTPQDEYYVSFVLAGLVIYGIPTIMHGIVTGMIGGMIDNMFTRIRSGKHAAIIGS